MLYRWLYEASDSISALNVFRYITFRTFISFFTAFFLCWILGPYFIRHLVKKQVGQSIREDGPQSHKKKAGTPTMGGGLILMGLLAPAILWVDMLNPMVWAVLVVTYGFGLIGYRDDYLKVAKKNSKGLSGRLRLLLEFLISGLVVAYLVWDGQITTVLSVPFLKEVHFDLGWFYVPFAALTIVGCANAVNLTDGLDGLAIFPVIVCAGTFMIFAYVAGHSEIARYLAIPFVTGSGELTILAAAVVASGLAFL